MLNLVQEWRVACVQHCYFLFFLFVPAWALSIQNAWIFAADFVSVVVLQISVDISSILMILIVAQLKQTCGALLELTI